MLLRVSLAANHLVSTGQRARVKGHSYKAFQWRILLEKGE